MIQLAVQQGFPGHFAEKKRKIWSKSLPGRTLVNLNIQNQAAMSSGGRTSARTSVLPAARIQAGFSSVREAKGAVGLRKRMM